MYAYVRYADKQTSVLPVSLIRRFTPKHIEDFDPKKTKLAFWQDLDGGDGEYYDCRVVMLGEAYVIYMKEKNKNIQDSEIKCKLANVNKFIASMFFLEKGLFDALCYEILALQICDRALYYDSVVELPGFERDSPGDRERDRTCIGDFSDASPVLALRNPASCRSTVIRIQAEERKEVRHSQFIRDALLRPWLLIKPDDEVLVAHCTCMSGLGEACCHVGAVLFYMEAVVRRRNDQACTDQDNAWLPPHVRVVDCVPIAKIDFSSSEMKKRKLDGEELRDPVAAQKSIEKVTEEEWEMFMERCHQAGSRPALLLLSEKYAHEFVPLATKFPRAILSNLASHDPTPAWEELVVQCAEVANRLAIEPQVAALIQEQTTEQAGSTKWFSFRAGRITASNARTVCKTSVSQPSQSLLKKICHPMESQFWSPAVAWGRNNEPKARQVYEAKAVRLHEDFSCRRSGLHISSKHPFLGATPDGLIDCSCCGPWVLEVKCPYTFRDNFIKEMPGQKYSCLFKQGDDMMLLEDHIFYYQVQTQMLVCNREYCDFVVWTSKDVQDFRIARDEHLCKDIVASCGKYFQSVLFPELIYKYWSTRHAEAASQAAEVAASEESEPDSTYCHCSGPESGDMIRCDGVSCEYKWLHFACVNLKRAPKARKWYCMDCKNKNKQ
ncbi:hypothetical protein HPB47_017868 [Ixodes persulcatus]|uniref:Uncharacterized protein n=1 Tax=Ixodes persulcatus TaxID=34615 RepID=A0AC60QM71_IXOPE|nr:hypothetical protein HPB47_017868 [Ixodes persulcatus]